MGSVLPVYGSAAGALPPWPAVGWRGTAAGALFRATELTETISFYSPLNIKTMAKTIPQGPNKPEPVLLNSVKTLETPEQLVTRINETLAKYPLEDVNRIISTIIDNAGKRMADTLQTVEKEHERVAMARKEFHSIFAAKQ
jgi:hypothetical protein